MILVDTNVLVDVLRADATWLRWSVAQLRQARLENSLCINLVVYAELCAHEDTGLRLDDFLLDQAIDVRNLTRGAARLAALAFAAYRNSNGTRTGVLPDFFIGAQAQAEGWTILTRDKARYKTYFPKVQLICP